MNGRSTTKAWVAPRSPFRGGTTVRHVAIVAVVILIAAVLLSLLPATLRSAGFLASALRFATPLAFGALAGVWAERAGVVNIGIEGMMLAGAFSAFWGSSASGSWVFGIILAMLVGALVASVLGLLAIWARGDQVVIGMAINLVALGMTSYLLRLAYPGGALAPSVDRVPDIDLPFLGVSPIGPIVNGQSGLIWLAGLCVLVTFIVLFRTPFGFHVRAVGENALAADAAGLSVRGHRYVAVLISGVLASIGGAFLSIGFVGTFTENMTEGRGYIALAAVILGRWQPAGVLITTLLFGGATAAAQRLQGEVDVSASLLATFPYVVTLIVLAGWVGRARPPADLGKPYGKTLT